MSDLPLLRQFLNERLIAAAEEVFGAVEKIVVDLQREVSRTKEDSERQRRLLDAVIKPDLILRKIDHPPDISPPAPVEVHPQREQWFGLIQEDPATPPRVKVEPHLWSGQTGGELFHGLDTSDPTSPPPLCVESDSDIVRVEVGPELENRLHTNNRDSDREHAGLEASNDFEHLSAPDGSSEEYQYQCNVCGKCFKYKASFKSHKLIHSSEKPYRCKECGSSFRYRGHLNRHKQKHEDQRLLKSECRAVGFAKEENVTFHQARCEERTTYRRAESGDGLESNDVCLKDESRTCSLEEPCRSEEEVPSEQKPSERGFYDLLVPENPGELPQIKQEENPWTGQIGELDTDPTAAHPPCVERDPDVVRVEVGPYLSPEVENILLTNTYGDIDRGHVSLESGQYLSAAVPVGFSGDCQYQCKVCGKCFKYKGNLKCHKLIHTGEKPYKCKECNLSFRYKGHLNRHRRVHTGEKPYTCQICGKGFTRNESLTFHCENQHLKPRFLVHREEPPPPQGRSQENVWARVEMGRGPEVSFTGSVLPPPWAASDGVLDVPPPSRRFHSVAMETGLWPDTDRDVLGGGRGEVDPPHLSAPVPTSPAEEKPYRCEFCGKCFKYKSNFNGHKLIHTGEKPHKCKECSLSFRYRGHLNRHKWVHTGEKPYKCKTCGKRFTRKESLTCHKLSHGGGV